MSETNADKNLAPNQFRPGGKPGPGRPKGSRDKLQRNFLLRLSEDFEAHGAEAIADCRQQNPAAYIKAIASLMPKEVELKRPLEGLSDDDLARIAEQLRDLSGAGSDLSEGGVGGDHAAPGGEPACNLPTLQ